VLVSLAFPNWLTPAFRPWTGWVAWFALVPLFAAIEGAPAGRAAVAGWIAGFASFLSTLYWLLFIEQVRPWNIPAWTALSLILGGYWALWAAVAVRGGRRALPLVAPAAWGAIELLRGRLFTGFPWAVLGTSQWAFPGIFLSARFWGAAGVSMAVVAVNVLAWSLLRSRRSRAAAGTGGVAMAAAGAAVFLGGAVALSAAGRLEVGADLGRSRGSLRTVLLQGSFTETEKMILPPLMMVERFERLALAEAARGKADLMVWPETATASDIASDPGIADRAVRLARRTGATHLVGALWHDPQLHIYNGAFVVARDGLSGAYYKSHLVPWGEYIPGWFRTLFPFARKATEGIIDLSAGPGPVPVALPGGAKVGVAVCYEAIFPEHGRALAAGGAEAFVNVTNDAWYGKSAASYQHALGPIARAVENGRYLARCANTGVSFIVDPLGRPGKDGGLFEVATIGGEMALITGRTFYTAHGDLAVWLALAAALALVTALSGAERRASGRQSGESDSGKPPRIS
jgi:apolipoprotein N-acyltransferase